MYHDMKVGINLFAVSQTSDVQIIIKYQRILIVLGPPEGSSKAQCCIVVVFYYPSRKLILPSKWFKKNYRTVE